MPDRPPVVQDPGLRHLLRVTRRALLAVAAAIKEVTEPEPPPVPPAGREEVRRVA